MPQGLYIRTEEHRKNMSKALKGRKTWIKGKHHRQKAKDKISKANKGRLVGSKNPNWKDGITKDRGYICIKQLSHPRANTYGYVKESVLVMEKHLNRFLKPEEIVHHINKIKDDNRIENLQLFPNQNEHTKFHMLNIECPKCGFIFSH